jgi:hypothetical protein
MRKFLYGILGLVVLLVVALGVMTLVAPTDFAVEKEVVINKPKAEVFGYVR